MDARLDHLGETVTRTAVWRARLTHRIVPVDRDQVPLHGGVLLVSNPLDANDRIYLQAASPRKIHFVEPATPDHAERIHKLLQLGAVACLFVPAEGVPHLTQLVLPPDFETVMKTHAVPVLPVWVDRIWPRIFDHRCHRVYFQAALPPAQATFDSVRSALLGLGVRALQDQLALREHVGLHALAGAKKNFFKDLIIDAFQGGKTLTGGKLMAVSLALSNWIRSNIPEERIGLVLPPGLAGSIANLACVLADKIPVNLNFTAQRSGLESALQRGEITTVLTAQAMKDRLQDFPWPAQCHDIKTLLQELPSWHIKIWWFRLLVLPAQVIRLQLGLPHQADRREAALLFTSGSSGEPKGVVLSHRNILANVAQIKAVFWQRPIDSLLGCLPIFHSFGCTVTFWWPLLGGPKIVTYPNPLETAKLAEIIERYRVTVFINTPTFLRSYLRKAKPEQLRSVKTIVTGAEKCPVDLIQEFESKFEVPICEGYGMTEATPVVAVNLLTDWAEGIRQTRDSGRRKGSVGPLLPGMDVQIRHPDTDELLLPTQSGLLWLKGPNIFNGYLRDPERSHQVLRDGWYKTGDIGRLDADGFLHIEGRLTRFSKIAGEMVPHGVIEDALRIVLQAQEEEVISFFVTGIPDAQRGEELVVLTTRDWDWASLKQALAANGLPNLWIPKTVKKVEKIPLLATGKLDLHACQELAKQ